MRAVLVLVALLAVAVHAASVREVIDASISAGSGAACSTSNLNGLNLQLVGELNCMLPGFFVSLEGVPSLQLGAGVFPFLQKPAAEALVRAAAAMGSRLTINSMLRTVAQQLMLRKQGEARKCGIGLAARPPRSNHNQGTALDVQQYDAWKTALTNQQWKWLGAANDPWHYDFKGERRDVGAMSLVAFVRLWNRNNEGDQIEETGAWNADIERAMLAAPADGFATGPQCEGASSDPPRVDIDAATSGAGLPANPTPLNDGTTTTPREVEGDPPAGSPTGAGNSNVAGTDGEPRTAKRDPMLRAKTMQHMQQVDAMFQQRMQQMHQIMADAQKLQANTTPTDHKGSAYPLPHPAFFHPSHWGMYFHPATPPPPVAMHPVGYPTKQPVPVPDGTCAPPAVAAVDAAVRAATRPAATGGE